MINKNSSDKIISDLTSKYGFLLNLRNENNTQNFQHDLFRVRIANKHEHINGQEQLSYPKSNVSSGRCNFENDPIFYCSDKSTTAIAETLKYKNPIDNYLYLSVWRLKFGMNINIFPFLDRAKQEGLLVDIDVLGVISDEEKRNIAKKQLLEVEEYFYDIDHSKSASICHILFNRKNFPCDCIMYPSFIAAETGINVSIKTDFVDKYLMFQRAYKFELFGEKGDYKMNLLSSTISKGEFVWEIPSSNQIPLNTLVKDLDYNKSYY